MRLKIFLLRRNSDKAEFKAQLLKPGHLRVGFLVPFKNVAVPTELSHYPGCDNNYSYF